MRRVKPERSITLPPLPPLDAEDEIVPEAPRAPVIAVEPEAVRVTEAMLSQSRQAMRALDLRPLAMWERTAEIAAMLGRILTRLGHTVDVVLDGNAAVARIAERHYDLVVSDIRMPGLDGPSLWRRIVADQPRLARRVLFVTGDTLSGSAASFLAESGAPCVEKPFRPAQIQAAITALFTPPS